MNSPTKVDEQSQPLGEGSASPNTASMTDQTSANNESIPMAAAAVMEPLLAGTSTATKSYDGNNPPVASHPQVDDPGVVSDAAASCSSLTMAKDVNNDKMPATLAAASVSWSYIFLLFFCWVGLMKFLATHWRIFKTIFAYICFPSAFVARFILQAKEMNGIHTRNKYSLYADLSEIYFSVWSSLPSKTFFILRQIEGGLCRLVARTRSYLICWFFWSICDSLSSFGHLLN